MDAAALGVQFAEMVLRVMPQGPAAVEAADGIDALEALQFRCDGVSRFLTCRDAASAASSHRLQPPSWGCSLSQATGGQRVTSITCECLIDRVLQAERDIAQHISSGCQLRRRGPSDLQTLATELVDHYFGDDYGLEE